MPKSRFLISRRPGLTLMELVVVLTILAALAAILIPLLPNFLRSAHKASSSTNIGEVTKALQVYQATYYNYPNDLDLLTDGTNLVAYLPSTTIPYNGLIVKGTLSATGAKYLGKVGITRFQKLATTPAAGEATQNPYATLDPATDGAAVAAGLNIAVLDNAAVLASGDVGNELRSVVASDPTAVYMAVGIGSRNTAIGRTMLSAPVIAPYKGDMNPANVYSRFVAIFKIDGGNEIPVSERARLICVVHADTDELETLDVELNGYFRAAPGQP